MSRENTVKFTSDRIREFESDGERICFFWDTQISGLGIRVTATGYKSYIFQYRIGNRAPRMTIGACKDWPLSKAREEARRLRRIVDTGEDPRKTKAAQIAKDNAGGKKLTTIFDEYVKAHTRQWSPRTMADTKYHSKKDDGVMWPLLQKRIEAVDAKAFIKWANDSINAPAQRTTNKGRNSALAYGYRRFKAFWRWMYQDPNYKAVMASPDIFDNRELKSLLPSNKPKTDALTRDQLPTWFGAVQKISTPEISAYLQILLLTGARRNELTRLQWKDVDYQWNKIWLHDKVDDEGRTIPMTPYVRHLIKDLENRLDRKIEKAEQDGKEAPKKIWVFTSPTAASGHIEEPRIAHKRALADSGITDLTLHGLRRSFKSLSEWVEMPVGIVAQIMGHKPSATAEKHYTVRPVDLLAIWHTKLERWILEQGEVQFNEKAAEEGLHAVEN